MTREETIKYLNLSEDELEKESDKESVYNINQKKYASIFTLLDRNESDWNEDSEEIDNSNEDKIVSKYYSSTGELTLDADLDKDTYTITIKDN